MSRFLISRALQSVVVLAIVSLLVFALIGLMPGDPVDLMLSANPTMTSEDAARIRAMHGLDRPLLERYATWLGSALQGDLGYSRLFARPVMDVMVPALANTFRLMGLALLLSLAIALPAGIYAALHPRSAADYGINIVAFAGVSVPPFWIALLFILVFAVGLGVLPAGGAGTPGVDHWTDTARHLILPVASLTVASVGGHIRYVRAAMIETMRQDFIRTARAKGLSRFRVVAVHALRAALISVVTVVALEFGYLFSGALITETVFAYPGMGKLIFDSIMGNDFNLALIALLFATALTLTGNLFADGLYVALDPRITFAKVRS
jgi:peptide/nickel transport system permease protein